MKEQESPAPFKKNLGEPFAEGSHTKIFRYGESTGGFPIIIKEGKTSYAPPFLKCLEQFASLNREKVSRFLTKILGPEFKIQPDFDLVKSGVAEYFLMNQYFGYDEKNPDASQKNREELMAALEKKEDPFYQELQGMLGDPYAIEVLADIIKKHQKDNFLPREIGTVIGHPQNFDLEKASKTLAERKKLPSTYYIVQEEVKGKNLVPLSDLSQEELNNHPEVLEKLLMFALLTKKMYSDTGKLIDLRPEEFLKNPLEHFQKTANLLVDLGEQNGEEKLFFVDTRWLWDQKSRVGEGGINFIKLLGVASIDRAIKKYLMDYMRGRE